MTFSVAQAFRAMCQNSRDADHELMPQRGYSLQPRVDASATLGTATKPFSTAKRLRISRRRYQQDRRNRVAVEGLKRLPQGSRATRNPGLKTVAPSGQQAFVIIFGKVRSSFWLLLDVSRVSIGPSREGNSGNCKNGN